MTVTLPTPPPLSRRQVLTGGVAMLFVVGCAPGPAGGGDPAAGGAYPRDVEHYGGTTTVPARPQRIVLLTPYNELAALLSVGIAPTQYSYASDLPTYLQAELDRLGATPTALPGTDFVANLESVAAARPDVIIGDPDGVELSGPRLAQIAPLIVVPGTARGGWRPNLRIVGDVFDLRERAESAIADTDARLAALAELDFGGVRTVSALVPSPGDGVLYLLNDPTNQTTELLAAAGLGTAPEVRDAPETLSLERLDVLAPVALGVVETVIREIADTFTA